jgi:hypothetical protein
MPIPAETVLENRQVNFTRRRVWWEFIPKQILVNLPRVRTHIFQDFTEASLGVSKVILQSGVGTVGPWMKLGRWLVSDMRQTIQHSYVQPLCRRGADDGTYSPWWSGSGRGLKSSYWPFATPLVPVKRQYSEIGSECLTSCKCLPAPWKWVQPFFASIASPTAMLVGSIAERYYYHIR